MEPSVAELLDSVRGLSWPSRRPVQGGIAGTHHSRLRGSAPELAEYRLYRQGDEPRRIDWKLLARTDRAFIRLAPDRSTLRTMIIVDASASMAFPEPTLAKWRLARHLAIGLAAVAHGGGDPVGIVASGSPPRVFAPRARRGTIPQIASLLERVAPGGAVPLGAALEAAGATPRIAVISDFLADIEPVLRWARAHAAAGGLVHLVHVVAVEEVAPPAMPMTAVDPENAAVTRPFDERLRDDYVRAFTEWRSGFARRARDSGAIYALVDTGEPPARAIHRLVAPAMAVA